MYRNIYAMRKQLSRGYARLLDTCGYRKAVKLHEKFPVVLSSYSRNAPANCEKAAGDIFVSWLNREGVNVLDIGANYGRYTLMAALLNKPGHAVVAVEADWHQFRALKRNVELNNLNGVRLFNNAAWDRDDVITFHISDGGRSSAASTWGTNFRKTSVTAVTVDDLCASIGFVPDVVKIDIEGAEYKCLSGMQRILHANRPKLLIELHPIAIKEIGGTMEQIHRLLQDHGYELRDLDGKLVASLGRFAEDHKMIVAVAS